jgi:DNA polymerase-3 subunit chi
MPQVEFFVLSDAAPDAHLRQACRLAEQAVDEGHRVFMRATHSDDAKRIDDLLWTFGDRSFLPHELAGPNSPSHPRIRILVGAVPPENFCDVLINLSTDIPIEDSIARILELVPADVEKKRAARERFKNYRDRGIEPATLNMSSGAAD